MISKEDNLEEVGETGGYHPSIVARVFGSNFRNYLSLDVELDPGFNVVSGANAQGKTSLLEAVHYVATSRLLRSPRDAESIHHGAAQMNVGLELRDSRTELEIRLERGSRKKAFLNGTSLRRASDLIGRVPVTSISSLDLVLAKGEPTSRRQFLDIELSQLYPGYLTAFSHYKRALEHRNALLKLDVPPQDAHLESWETALAEHGSAIRSYRSEYVRDLAKTMELTHPVLAGGETVSLSYEQSDDAVSAHDLLEGLFNARRVDLARGSTTIGPHRDDLSLCVNQTDVRAFGSQGQQRTTVISLKLASLLYAKQIHRFTPILLLDDILSDLDESRRTRLTEWVLSEASQTILTCTEAEAAGRELLTRARIFRVESGQITRE